MERSGVVPVLAEYPPPPASQRHYLANRKRARSSLRPRLGDVGLCKCRHAASRRRLSFATVVITPKVDGPSTVEGVVCARLRLSLAGAMDLRNMLDKILKKSMAAKRETH
jgi:hypothetical protein